jgi:hypothetical protein
MTSSALKHPPRRETVHVQLGHLQIRRFAYGHPRSFPYAPRSSVEDRSTGAAGGRERRACGHADDGRLALEQLGAILRISVSIKHRGGMPKEPLSRTEMLGAYHRALAFSSGSETDATPEGQLWGTKLRLSLQRGEREVEEYQRKRAKHSDCRPPKVGISNVLASQ